MTYYYDLLKYCKDNGIPCEELEPNKFELNKVRGFMSMGSLEDLTAVLQMLLYITNPYFKERINDYNDYFIDLVDIFNQYRRR